MSRPDWKTRIGKYTDRTGEIALRVGEDEFTRLELSEKLGTQNFIAAERLSRIIKGYRPKSVQELASRIDQWMMRKHDSVGNTTIYVWCLLLEKKGLSVNAWLDQDFTVKRHKTAKLRLVRSKVA